MTETEFVQQLLPSFRRHFNVETEVWSKCRTGRIDIVLKYRYGVYFGIECKIPDKKKGEKIGEYVKQAIRYKDLLFEVEKGVFKKIPIFICPPLSYKYFILNEKEEHFDSELNLPNNNLWHQDRHYKNCNHHTFNGFLGAFGIGEVRKNKYFQNKKEYFYFVISNKTIFSSFYNTYTDEYKLLHEENYLKILKKLGI